jgi:CshA-type fibril repeat protein
MTPGGTSSPGNVFTYVVAPAVTSISPASGSTDGGTSVSIDGTGFTAATAVDFGSAAATAFTVDSATKIIATAPPRSAGTVDIRVTTAGGTSPASSADRFTFVTPPTITTLGATSGSAAGGTTVTITGTGFTQPLTVTFGGTAATTVTVDSDTGITATAPAHAAGTVDVRVTTAGGVSAITKADKFTYTAPAPANQPPAFTAAASNTGQSVTAGTGLTALAATDPDNDALTYDVSSGSLPAGITLSNDGSFAGSTTTAGDTTAGITVADGHGGTATINLTVHVTAAVTSNGQGTTPQTTDVTVPAGGSVSLVDGGKATETVTIDGQGTYTLDPDTGVITFEPVLGFAGNADPITFAVTDANGNSVTSHYTAHVTAPPPPVRAPRETIGAARQSTTIALPAGGSIMLLDANGKPATEVTVPDVGTYRLVTPSAALVRRTVFHAAAAPESAVITFTPVAGYTGKAPAVTFQVTDAYGQKATAEYTPTVTSKPSNRPTPPSNRPTPPSNRPTPPAKKPAGAKPATLPVTGPDALGTGALGLLLVAAGLIAVTRRRPPGIRRR